MSTLTKEQAIQLANSGWWKDSSPEDIVMFQLFQKRLCMPFGDFHGAVESCLKRSVWTHEFADSDALKKEFLGERPAPTMEQIINLIPSDKRIILVQP